MGSLLQDFRDCTYPKFGRSYILTVMHTAYVSNREEEAKLVLKSLRKDAIGSSGDFQDEFESIVKRKMSLEGPQRSSTAGNIGGVTSKLTRMWATLCSRRFWRPFSIVGVANTLVWYTGIGNLGRAD